jgi:competence protein ComEC
MEAPSPLRRHWRSAGRAAALVPLVAAANVPVPFVAAATALAAGAAGWFEATTRLARPSAWAASDHTPAYRNSWRGLAVARVTSWALPQSGDSWRGTAQLLALAAGCGPKIGEPPRAGESVLLYGHGRPPRYGERFAADLELEPPAGAWLAGCYDAARQLAGRGVVWRGRCARPRLDVVGIPEDDLLERIGGMGSSLRARWLATCDRLLPPREAEIAKAVLLGERSRAARGAAAPLTRLGLAHLFAVSGLHVGILLGVVGMAMHPFAPGPRTRCLVATAILPGYALVTGLSSSVLRATGLALVLLAAPLAGRPVRGLRVLGLLYWVSVLWEPAVVLDTGFRLSYLAATGIVATAGTVNRRLRGRPRFERGVWSLLVASLAAQWFTLPEVAARFGRFPVAAAAANLAAVPLFGAAVWLWTTALVVAGAFTFPARELAASGWLLVRLLEVAAAWAAAHGGGLALRFCGFGAVALALFVVASWFATLALRPRAAGCRRHRTVLLIGAAVLAAGALKIDQPGPRPTGGAEVEAVQFAVGQGDAAWIVLADGWSLLIDTGPGGAGGSAFAWSVGPWLARRGVRRIDVVVLTHGHADHTAGAQDAAAALTIDRWLLGGSAEAPPGCDPATVDRPAGETRVLHRAGRWSVVALAADTTVVSQSPENDVSLVIGLAHDDSLVALWTGDRECAGEAGLLAQACRPVRAAGLDYWKAGHHGSRTAGSAALLNALRPRLVGISCAVGNRHGHPDHGPYAAHGDTASVVRLDLAGSLYLVWLRDGRCRWRTERGSKAANTRGRAVLTPLGGMPNMRGFASVSRRKRISISGEEMRYATVAQRGRARLAAGPDRKSAGHLRSRR